MVLPRVCDSVAVDYGKEAVALSVCLATSRILRLQLQGSQLDTRLKGVTGGCGGLTGTIYAVRACIGAPGFGLRFSTAGSVVTAGSRGKGIGALAGSRCGRGLRRALLDSRPSAVVADTKVSVGRVRVGTKKTDRSIMGFTGRVFGSATVTFGVPVTMFLKRVARGTSDAGRFVACTISPVTRVLGSSFGTGLIKGRDCRGSRGV